jgi:hypothetical protein
MPTLQISMRESNGRTEEIADCWFACWNWTLGTDTDLRRRSRGAERESERESDRERDIKRDRERERERESDRKTERERER